MRSCPTLLGRRTNRCHKVEFCAKVGAMRDEPQLRLRVINDEIVVTLPGYHYAVTYSKPSQGRVLIARNSPPHGPYTLDASPVTRFLSYRVIGFPPVELRIVALFTLASVSGSRCTMSSAASCRKPSSYGLGRAENCRIQSVLRRAPPIIGWPWRQLNEPSWESDLGGWLRGRPYNGA